MAKTLLTSLGPAGTPHEVKQLRQSSFDLHQQIGSAVIYKHRWNADDVTAGRTTVCPNHTSVYRGRDETWDPVCFGTGYTGGFADGVVIFVTVQDTQETQIKIGPTGILTMDMHPAMTAPWMPAMGDGDMIITADFDPSNWDIVSEYERYLLKDVTPVTMRGPGWGRQQGGFLNRQTISQQSQLDKLPSDHPLYGVPIVFNYNNVMPIPNEISVVARIHGIDGDGPITINVGRPSFSSVGGYITGTVTNPGASVDI
jgi:hypothetical protein